MDVAIVRDTPFVTELDNLLAEGVRQAQIQGKPVLVSFAERISPVDTIAIFGRSRLVATDRFFWAQPGEDFCLVGVGAAHAIDAVEESRFRQIATSWQLILAGAIIEGPRRLPGVGPLLFGGFAFDSAYPQDPDTTIWQGYPAGRVVLPSMLFTIANGETWLTINILVTGESDVQQQSRDLNSLWHTLTASNALPKNGNGNGNGSKPNGIHTLNTTLHELRSAEDWQADVAFVAQAIRQGELEKAVLARGVKLQASSRLDISAALRKLKAEYVGCYIFAVAHGERCFLGATPEQLIRLRDRKIKAMSLAGSSKRGATPDEDEVLGRALLASAKNREEHVVVVRTMIEALQALCEDLQVSSEPSLLKLGNVQHLCTRITGQLAADYTLLDLVERLHPTPAVGGRPREIALKLIREREGLDRGWYAGPVGWLNQNDEGEFAVALRSALVYGEEATLFAGCGIVGDSDPEREFAESILKLKPMLSALTNP